MKSFRRFLPVTVAMAAALVIVLVTDWSLADVDVLSALTAGNGTIVVITLSVRLLARSFLWFLAPGWLVYVSAVELFDRLGRQRRDAG